MTEALYRYQCRRRVAGFADCKVQCLSHRWLPETKIHFRNVIPKLEISKAKTPSLEAAADPAPPQLDYTLAAH